MDNSTKSGGNFSLSYRDMIYSVLTATASSLSVFGGLGLILVYILFKDMRTGGRKLLMFIAMMDALTAIGNILGVIWLHCRTTPSCRNVYESMTFCRFHAILTIFSSISSNLWMVVMGTCLLVSIVHTKPSFAKQHMKKFYLICWPIAGFIAIVTLAANVVGFDPGIASWCWIDPNTPNMLAWQFFTGKLWEMLTYVITVVIYTYVRVYLWKRTSHSLAHQKQRSRQAALQDANRKLTFVPCVFIVLRIWGSLRFLLGSTAGYNSPWIAYLQGFGDSAQGFANFFIYCVLTGTVRMRLISKCQRKNRVKPDRGHNRDRIFTASSEYSTSIKHHTEVHIPSTSNNRLTRM